MYDDVTIIETAMEDEERPKGFLNEAQREALSTGEFYEGTESSDRVRRYRTKKRLKGALLDLQYLSQLRFEDIQSIFDWFYEDDTEPWEMPEYTDRQEEFERGVSELFAALYDGMGEMKFASALRIGVGRAIERRELAARDRLPEYDVQFNIELDEDRHRALDDLKQELEKHDGEGAPDSFITRDLWALWFAGEITGRRYDELMDSMGSDAGEEPSEEYKEEAVEVAEKYETGEAQRIQDLLYLVNTDYISQQEFEEVQKQQRRNVHVLYCQGPEEVAEQYKEYGHQIREEHQDALEAAWRAHESHVQKVMSEADGNVGDVPAEHLDCLEAAGLITDDERKSLEHESAPPRRDPRDPTAVPGDYTISPCDDHQYQPRTPQIPSQRKMIELLRSGDLSPNGYLDILETRFEEAPETLVAEDLWDLLRSERISEEAYLAADRSWEDDPSELPPEEERESIQEVYGDRQ
jgi:hypothetical protein